ncbi:MAG TPA: flagellar motor switch phosphatase FliY [Bacillales bacterium]|nr:flagellar motor switch phosphatase FliY [Bacillales bacterium]
MSDGQKLSQEEIDALLNGGSSDDNLDEINEYLSVIEADAIGEIGNISFGSAATALSELLRHKVEITTPTLSVVRKNDLKDEFPQPHIAVFVNYTEGFKGSNALVIRVSDACIIANLMMGGDGTTASDEIGEMEMSAVQEAMNQMMGSASTSMSTVFNMKVDISPPNASVLDFKENQEFLGMGNEEVFLKVSFNLRVGSLIDSDIMQLLPLEFAKSMVAKLVGNEDTQKETVKAEVAEQQEPVYQDLQEDLPEQQSENLHPERQQYQKESASQRGRAERQRHLGPAAYESRDIQSAVFSDFEDTEEMRVGTQNLNMLFDVPLQVTVELGRTKRNVKDILKLSPGSVIELDKLAGEPVDIYVNSKMIAKGEVVVIDENFGVRVTEISSQSERIQKIQ